MGQPNSGTATSGTARACCRSRVLGLGAGHGWTLLVVHRPVQTAGMFICAGIGVMGEARHSFGGCWPSAEISRRQIFAVQWLPRGCHFMPDSAKESMNGRLSLGLQRSSCWFEGDRGAAVTSVP